MQKTLRPAISDLMQFLSNAPTAWHATHLLQECFAENGFEVLQEKEEWDLKPEGKYVLERNGSSLCAFVVPKEKPIGLDLAASHTDSPALKLKPNSEYLKENMVMLGVEVYGAPLLSSWLNRDLGIAGRIVYSGANGVVKKSLVNWRETPVIIPQLAIHLDRQVNEAGLVLNKQEHLNALAGIIDNTEPNGTYLESLIKKTISFKHLLGTDLFLYPLDPPALLGSKNELLGAYRIDSLCSVHSIAKSLIKKANPHQNRIKMALFCDNEEVGSETAQGAGSPFFLHILERLTLALGLHREEFLRLHRHSQCISVDLAHALHPNYMEKHDSQHRPKLGKGIVIKFNAQQRYASDAFSSAHVVQLCMKMELPYQKFACRNDIPSGSTIGPIHASATGISTVDIGIPQLSMHSAREVIACQDQLDMCDLMAAYFSA